MLKEILLATTLILTSTTILAATSENTDIEYLGNEAITEDGIIYDKFCGHILGTVSLADEDAVNLVDLNYSVE